MSGFRPVGHISSSGYDGRSREYAVGTSTANAFFIGDLVTASGIHEGRQTIVLASENPTTAARAHVLGVIVGIDHTEDGDLGKKSHPANTAGRVFVADDPGIIYECVEDAIGSAINPTGVLGGVNALRGTGNAETGASGNVLDSSSYASTGFKHLQILGLANPNDGVGSVGNPRRWLCMLKFSQLASTTFLA